MYLYTLYKCVCSHSCMCMLLKRILETHTVQLCRLPVAARSFGITVDEHFVLFI